MRQEGLKWAQFILLSRRLSVPDKLTTTTTDLNCRAEPGMPGHD